MPENEVIDIKELVNSLQAHASDAVRRGNIYNPVYRSWESMRYRCDNPSYKKYKNYGGRGITYDPLWEQFLNFFIDMLPTWSPKKTLDRIDVDANYYKANCRWLSLEENSRWSRKTILTFEKAEEIRKLSSSGISHSTIAEMFGLGGGHVSHIVSGRIWVKEVL